MRKLNTETEKRIASAVYNIELAENRPYKFL